MKRFEYLILSVRIGKAAILILLFFFLPFFSTSAENRTVPWKERGYDLSKIEHLIHDMINIEREHHKLNVLTWNTDLNIIARGHSRDMVKRNFFSHTTPEGYGFPQRYSKAGFSCSLRSGNTIFTGAENISQDNLYHSVKYRNNIPSYQWNSSREIARSVVDRWMNSPPHRKNILFPHWRSEGIGISITEEGKVLITQNFC